MGVKVLTNLVNKNDVIAIITSIISHLDKQSNHNSIAYLEIVRDAVKNLTAVNIVNAGDINIVCENADDLKSYLKKYR